MRKNVLKPLLALTGLLLLLVVVAFGAGAYMVNYALCPKNHGQDLTAMHDKWQERMPGIMEWYDSLHQNGTFVDTFVLNSKGLMQHAVLASAPKAAEVGGTAVLVHGYTDNHLSMMHLARMWRDSLNFNVLVFDQQFHGLSEGKSIQMGWKDRYNAAMWAEIAAQKWGSDFVVVHGVSMGGATTMMLSGGPDPDCVSAYVDDCGYSSVWNQFSKQLNEDFHLPNFPVLHAANLICRIKYGWGFKEASSLKQLAASTKPVLFIHGDSDTYVPTADVYKNYEAKTNGLRKLWIAPNAIHARAYQQNQAEYTQTVREFVAEIKNAR